MNYLSSFSLVWIGMLLIVACQGEKDFSLPYEKFVLDNGLQVVLHEDKSDPIVSVAIQYHVGSAREKPGKTGFAHLFEHMLFQRSEHLGRNEFFKKIGELGGSFNGATGPDGTVYYETVPRDALEKVLWSGSGKGLRWCRRGLTKSTADWCRRELVNHGALILEPIYKKEGDFAMEFYSNGRGKVLFSGYSHFITDEKGVYRGNMLVSNEEVEQWILR